MTINSLLVPKFKRNTLLWIFWLTLVTYASLASLPQQNDNFIHVPHFDKVVHFLFYGVMSFMGVLAYKDQFGKSTGILQVMLLSLCFAIVYGIIIEVLQYSLTVDRHGDLMDVLANSFGALVGILAIFVIQYGRWPLK
jgi:VanZ family protein